MFNIFFEAANMKKLAFVVAIFFTLTFNGQELFNDEIANINGIVITADEFLERIELNPQFRRNIKEFSPALKLEFLLTLIAEKLQAEQARFAHLDTTEAIKTAKSSIEKMYVRDALFNREIRSKIKIDENDYLKGLIRNQTIYKVRYLYSKDSIDIADQYNELIIGKDFNSILSERPEFKDQENPILVYFGDLIKPIEDALYELSANEYTRPKLGPDGWYIFYVYETIDNSPKTPQEKENSENTVRKILESDLGETIQAQYYRNFFANKNIDVNRQLFDDLFNQLDQIFMTKSMIKDPESTTLIHLDAYDVKKIKLNIGEEKLNTSFVQFQQNPVSLNEFINEMAFNGYNIEEYSREGLREKLSVDVRIFIERELLAREGYRMNLQNNDEVKKYMRMWTDHYLSQSYIGSKIDELNISDDEARKYYDAKNKPTEYSDLVNIIEIFSTDKKVIQKVKQLAIDGSDFRELAKKYNERVWTKSTSGEYGLFPSHMFGKVGSTATELSINEVSEILELDEGYSIIKLIDKQQQKVEPPSKSFDELKNQLKREIAYERKINELVESTASMANQSDIKINYSALNSLNITNINSFAIRVMGFGGKITPVPIVKPFVEWVDGWKSKSNVLP